MHAHTPGPKARVEVEELKWKSEELEWKSEELEWKSVEEAGDPSRPW